MNESILKTKPYTMLFFRVNQVVTEKCQPILIALVLTTLFFTICLKWFTLRYDANDDLQMMFIASGALTGVPDPHLIFSNIIIGQLLVFLYKLTAEFNWYSLYLYIVHFFASTAIIYCIVWRKRSLTGIFYAALFLFGCEYYLLTSLQFTTTATIIGVAGYFLIITFNKKFISWQIIVGILFFLISAMIRDKVFFLLLVLLTAYSIYIFVRDKQLKRMLVYFSMLIMLFASAKLYDNSVNMQSTTWRQFFILTRARIVHDSGLMNYSSNTSAMQNAGLDNDDCNLFNAWFFEDTSVFSIQKLNAIRTNSKNYKSSISILQNMIQPFFRPFLLIQIVFIVIAFLWNRKQLKYHLLLLFLPIFFLSCYFSLTNRIPSRLAFSMIAPIFSLSILQLSSLKKNFTVLKQLLLVLFFATLLGLCLFNNYRLEKRVSTTTTVLNEFNKQFSGQWTVMLGRALIFDEINPLYNFSNFSAPKMYFLSWMCNSPINNLLLKQMNSNTIIDGLLKNNVNLVVHVDDKEIINNLQNYYKKHFNKNIEVVYKQNVGSYLLVYNLFEI